MSGRKKILIIDNCQDTTGAFKSIVSFCSALKSDFDFVFAIPKKSSNLPLLEKEFKTYQLPYLELQKSYKILLYFPVLILNFFRLKEILHQEKISIIHVNDVYNMLPIFGKKMGLKYKLIYHVRLLNTSYIQKLYSFFSKQIKQHADHIICVSDAAKNSFDNHQKCRVIYNPINLEENLPKVQHTDKSTYQLLYLANYTPGKGHEDAITLLKNLQDQNFDIHLKCIGGTLNNPKNEEYKNSLGKLAEKMQVSSSCSFQSKTEAIEKAFKEADLFLNFSHSESFSRTCLEASFYGIPTITFDSGGPKEIIENSRTGYVIPVGAVEEATEKVISLLQDAEKRQQFAENGRSLVSTKFDEQATILALKKLYSEI